MPVLAGRGGVAGEERFQPAKQCSVGGGPIESAGGRGYLLAQQLVAAGKTVVDVPAGTRGTARSSWRVRAGQTPSCNRAWRW